MLVAFGLVFQSLTGIPLGIGIIGGADLPGDLLGRAACLPDHIADRDSDDPEVRRPAAAGKKQLR